MAHFCLFSFPTEVGEGMEGKFWELCPESPLGDFHGLREGSRRLFLFPLPGSDLHPDFLGGGGPRHLIRWIGSQRDCVAWHVFVMTLWEGLPQATPTHPPLSQPQLGVWNTRPGLHSRCYVAQTSVPGGSGLSFCCAS